MYWTLELASKLEDAPWPASKDELIDYAIRSGAPMEVIENLQDIEDDEEIFESIEDIWPFSFLPAAYSGITAGPAFLFVIGLAKRMFRGE